jgi:hypothetical protein
MKYKCALCQKEFSQKSNYDAHIKRKYKCNVNMIINNDLINLTQNNSNITQNNSNITQNNLNNVNNIGDKTNEKLLCKFCNKKYSRVDNLNRHINDFCKEKIKYEQNNVLKENYNKLQDEINLLKNDYHELKELYQVSKSKNSNKNYNTINAVINTNNNTITNNLLLNFGSEDITKISEDDIFNTINTINDVFPSFIKLIHANKNLPECSNLKVPNMRSKYGFMLENGKFVSKSFQEIIDELKEIRLPELIDYVTMFYEQGKISKSRYDFIINTLNFIKNKYITTEDVDGNIIRGEKNDVKLLKEHYDKIIRVIYDNMDTINFNINLINKTKIA